MNDSNVYEADAVDLVVQAIAALGSFAYGNDLSVNAVVGSGAVPALFKFLNHKNDKVVESAARTLKMLFQSKLAPHSLIAKDNIITTLIRLISNSPDRIAELAASVLARCCNGDTQLQETIANAGGLEAAVGLLSSSFPKSQEAALDVISSLITNNDKLCAKFASFQSAFEKITKLLKDKVPRTRLLASKCITHLNQASSLPETKRDITAGVVPILVKLMSSEQQSVREEAPHTLASLIEDSEKLQQIASDADCIPVLASFINDKKSSDQLKQSSLNAVAVLCSRLEDCRKKVIESKVLHTIVALLENQDAALRMGACKCVRSLSRSVKNLRSSLIDVGIALPLVKLLNDPIVDVQAHATAALCNIILDFSPMKQSVIEQGAIDLFVSRTTSMDHQLRLNSVWALASLLYMADSEAKEAVLKLLTFNGLLELISDSEPTIQKQALTLLRNMTHKHADIVMQHAEHPQLMSSLERILSSTISGRIHEDVILQALYSLCNIATGRDELKEQIMESEGLLQRLKSFLSMESTAIRLAALRCILNLVWMDGEFLHVEDRTAKLHNMGFKNSVQLLLQDPDKEIVDTARCVVQRFEDTVA